MSINSTDLLQRLIRFNTTNPPGAEKECILYLKSLFDDGGFETRIQSRTDERPNLIVKLPGRGEAAPFLMYGHADVVTVEGQEWKYPAFDGVIADGCVWGRGALDMKGALTMMSAALLKLKEEGFVPPGDILLCIVADEEEGGAYGARYLIETHGDIFQGVRYAIGEIGGFTMHIGGKSFYPVMVAEKQRCWFQTKVKGAGGHGSLPVRGGAMAKTGRILNKFDSVKFPIRITPPVRLMIEAFAREMPFPSNLILKQLLNPLLTERILRLLGPKGVFFEPILRHTVNVTMVSGGHKINVVPTEVTISFDGRILPGFKPEDMLGEIKRIIGLDLEFEVLDHDPGPGEPDMGRFDLLAGILREGDRDAVPIPFVVSGSTDARFFARLGIQTYGFTPMKLPEKMDFAKLIHGPNERIPVEALHFGTEAVYKLLRKI